MKGIIIPWYIFAQDHITSYSPYIDHSVTDGLIANAITYGWAPHPWNDSVVGPDVDALYNLAAAYPNVPIIIVVNGGADGVYWHDSGGTYDSVFHSQLQRLRSVGVKVAGYFTGDCQVAATIAEMEEEVDRWVSMYGDILDGFFVDNVATPTMYYGCAVRPVSDYDTLFSYIRTKTVAGGTPFIIGNIGAANAPVTSYFNSSNAADIWMVYETNNLPTTTALDAWPGSADKKAFGALNISSESISDATFYSLAGHVGYVYYSERDGNSNTNYPYQHLPSWLTRQVQLLSSINPGLINLPSVSMSPTITVPTLIAPPGTGPRRFVGNQWRPVTKKRWNGSSWVNI